MKVTMRGPNMGNTSLIRTALLVALITAFGLAATGRAPAAEPPAPAGEPRATAIKVVGSEASSQFIPIGVGKSVVIDLPRDVKDVLVADPSFANAVIRSARRAYIIGVKIGQTSVYFFDADGHQIAGFDIAVTRDLNGLRAALKQGLPGLDIHVEGLGTSVVLTGNVSSPTEAQQAYDIAARLVGDSVKVVNSLVVAGRDQVMLKVTVAEVQRTVIKQLGIDLNGSVGYGATVVNFNTNNPFTALGQSLSTPPSFLSGHFKSVTATLQAMERAGVLHTLAEPNLTAISGESANFLAGGEFPVLTGYTCQVTGGINTCQPQVQFKKFGVGLNFTPVVLSEVRVSLKVMSEV